MAILYYGTIKKGFYAPMKSSFMELFFIALGKNVENKNH